MKIRNTHCIEVILQPGELAAALGHPEAEVREAEVSLKDGRLHALRVHHEYVIATKGIPKVVRRLASSTADDQFGG